MANEEQLAGDPVPSTFGISPTVRPQDRFADAASTTVRDGKYDNENLECTFNGQMVGFGVELASQL